MSEQDDVVELCRDLIRIDTSNPGDGTGPGERAAAEWVAERLTDAGLAPEVYESEPGRASVVARWAGRDSSRPALVLHGHLDVVRADAADWQVDPFAAEIRDDCVWGRGAVDMKDMDAMILAVLGRRSRDARPPARDIVVTFFADEEAGGRFGSHWMVEHHRDLFEGATEAISEVGGFSVTANGKRLYLIQTAEKGMAWLRLTATGRAGHGSMANADNAVTELCQAVSRIGEYQWPVRMTETVRQFLDAVADTLGVPLDPDDLDATVGSLGAVSAMIGATLRNSANPTVLSAGHKVNVVPGTATAYVDGRFLPGYEEEFFATLDSLLGAKVRRNFINHDIALETSFDGDLTAAMTRSLLAEDPDGRTIPYCLSGGTDNKALSTLGITGYGFAPLRLPPELDFAGMFHGVDERVPLDSLQFGVRVLDRFLDVC